MTVDLLAIDLASCGRCTGTLANVEAALRTAATRLPGAPVAFELHTTVVSTAAEAERLRFASSPTLRVDGRDVALELRESPCEDCGTLCGGEDGVDCRVWVWAGQEHVVAPEAMIVEAVLEAYREGPVPASAPVSSPFHLPENLRRFFAARAAHADEGRDTATGARDGDRPSSDDGGCCRSPGSYCG